MFETFYTYLNAVAVAHGDGTEEDSDIHLGNIVVNSVASFFQTRMLFDRIWFLLPAIYMYIYHIYLNWSHKWWRYISAYHSIPINMLYEG